MRIDVYTWQDAYVATIGPDQLLSFTHTDELNGEDSVSITTTFPLEQGYRLVWADKQGKAHEHICQDPKGLRSDGPTVYTDTALNSVCELYGDYIEDKRPYSYSFAQALAVALIPTRWQAGTVDQPGKVSAGLTFYHTSAREALQAILECGGEMETTIEVSGGKVTARKVGIRSRRGDASSHRRFTYAKDLASISRTEHFSAITACYGYGKGEETDAGGYGRKLTFGDINGGLNYVADSAALKKHGRPNGSGGYAHVFGQYENSQCEDAAQLLSETKAYLAEHSEPGVTYEAAVVDLVQFGRTWEGVSVGDGVQIVDRAFSPELRCDGRVTKLVTDLLGGSQTVTLGNVTETIADWWASQQKAVSGLSRRSSSWDVAASTPAAYLQQVVDGLNEQFNLDGNSYCFTSFEKGTIYSSVPLDEDGNPAKSGGSALQLCSQGFRIASTTKADGTWDWRTFGTGAGFTADLITTGALNAGLITTGSLCVKSKSTGATLLSAGIDSGTVTIGGFTVGSSSLYNRKASLYSEGSGVYVGTDGISVGDGTTYARLTSGGVLTAVNAVLSGKVTATSGAIGGFTVESSAIYNDAMSLGTSGMWLTKGSSNIGLIGVNGVKSSSGKYGLNFDLEYDGAYMTWAAEDSASATTYSMKWTYARSGISYLTDGALNAGCDVDMRNWGLLRAGLKQTCWVDGGLTTKTNIKLTDVNGATYTAKVLNGFVLAV